MKGKYKNHKFIGGDWGKVNITDTERKPKVTNKEDCDLCYEGNCPHSCHSKHMDK